jgi:acyl carrier protein
MEERNEVLANIIKFAAMAYKKPEEEINENTNVSEELGVQSMQRVALSASIENEYDVMIPVARIGNFKTIGDIVDYVMDEM